MKLKKLFSVLTAGALSITMCLSMNLTASATIDEPIDVSSYDELKSAITTIGNDADKKGTINITADGISGASIDIYGLDLTINLNGHTVTSGLYIYNDSNVTINGDGGTIYGLKDTTEYYNMFATSITGSTLTATNTRFIGADGNATYPQGLYGISAGRSKVKLDNCYVQSGNVVNTFANTAIDLSESTLSLDNTTVANGSGTSNAFFVIIDNDNSTVYDLNGTPVNKSVYQVYGTATFGTGYTNVVSGGDIKYTDGTPAKASSPVTAHTTIPEPTYTIVIPANVDFGELKQVLPKYKDAEIAPDGDPVVKTQEFTVSAIGVDNLFDDGTKEPQIDLSVSFDGKLHQIVDADSGTIPDELKVIAWYISDDGECKPIGSESTNDPFCVFKNDSDLADGEKNEVNLAVSVNRADITVAGTYQGTMTFTVAIPNKE